MIPGFSAEASLGRGALGYRRAPVRPAPAAGVVPAAFNIFPTYDNLCLQTCSRFNSWDYCLWQCRLGPNDPLCLYAPHRCTVIFG